jgi:hypothetical protein
MSSRLLEAVILMGTLAAAVFIGKQFTAEAKKARRRERPWYAVYFTLPGVLILLAIGLPIAVWILRRLQ